MKQAWGITAAVLVGLIWMIWPGSMPAWAMLAASGLILPFCAPIGALVLMALTAPFELPLELFGYTVYSTEALLALALPAACWIFLRRPAWRRALAPLAGWTAPFLGVLLVSSLLAGWPHAWRGALRWCEFLWALALAGHWLRRGREAEAVIWALLAAAALCALQGLRQTLAGPTVYPDAAAIVLFGRTVTRAAAGYGANTLAMLLVLLLPFAAAAAVLHPRRVMRLPALAATLLMLAAWAATFSLTGTLALLTAAAIAVPRRKKISGWIWAALAAAACGAVAWSLSPAGRPFWITKLMSFHDRLDYLRVAIQLFRTAPWFGIGPGQYRLLAPALGQGINPVGLVTHPHSLYLTVLTELGLCGLAALAWALVRAGAFLARRLRRMPAGWPAAASRALAAGLAGFAAANFTDYGLVHDRGVHAALLLGAALVWVRRPNRLPPPERRSVFSRVWRDAEQAETPEALRRGLEERRQGRNPLFALLEQALAGRASARILELGCGPAWDALQLAQERARDVHALDFSGPALARAAAAAAALGIPLALHCADARRTGLEAESFDLVFSQGLLEHFPDPAPVWQETARLLKPGGCAVVDVPQTFNPFTVAKWWHRWRGDWPWGWETHYTPGRLRAEARACGLRFIAARGYGYRGGPLDFTAWLRRSIRPLAPGAWDAWERNTGAWWMLNVVMLFRKSQG
jgi:SAM-dependent methyltransferase